MQKQKVLEPVFLLKLPTLYANFEAFIKKEHFGFLKTFREIQSEIAVSLKTKNHKMIIIKPLGQLKMETCTHA